MRRNLPIILPGGAEELKSYGLRLSTHEEALPLRFRALLTTVVLYFVSMTSFSHRVEMAALIGGR